MIRTLKIGPSGGSDAKDHSFVVLNQFSAVAIVVS